MNRLFSHSFFQAVRSQSVRLGKEWINQVGKSYAHAFSSTIHGSRLKKISHQLFKQTTSPAPFSKLSLTDKSINRVKNVDQAEQNIAGICSAHLFPKNHQELVDKPSLLQHQNAGYVQPAAHMSEKRENLQVRLDQEEMRNAYARMFELSSEEPIVEFFHVLSSLFCELENESLLKKGKEVFSAAIAEGKDQLSAYACEIEFKSAAILLKMAEQGVIFHDPDSEIAAMRDLESQVAVLKQAISEYSGHAYDELRQSIIEEKKRLIHAYIEERFSFNIGGHFSLKSLLDDIFESSTLQVLLGITNIQGDVNPQLKRKLSLIVERENLEYMGVAFLNGLKKVFIALKESDGREEKILEILYPPPSLEPHVSTKASLNVETYKKEVEQKVVNRLGRLILDHDRGEGILHMLVKQYADIKIKVRMLIIQTIVNQCDEKKIKFLESLKTPTSSTPAKKEKMTGNLQHVLKEWIKEKVGLNLILDRFDQHADLLFYFMLDTMTEACDDIITHPSLAERPSKLEGVKSALPLKEAVKNFTNQSTSLLPASLKMILQPFIAIVEEQGDAKEIFDLMSPVIDHMIPKLRHFLKT